MGPSKSFLVFGLAAALTAAFAAGPRGDQAVYVGGTLSIPKGAQGVIDLSASKAFLFTYGEASSSIPYTSITGMEWGDKVGRREESMGAKTRSLMAAPIHLWKKKIQYLTLSFREGEDNQVAIFELAEDAIRPLAPALEARTGKKVEFEETLTSPPTQAPAGAAPAATSAPIVLPPAPSPMVDVSFVSKPSGALVLFYGMTAGKTPLTTKLMPGDYKVTLRASGMQDWTQDFSVEPAKPVSLLAELRPQAVVIEASTNHVVLPGAPFAARAADQPQPAPAKKVVRRKKAAPAEDDPPAENPNIIVGHVK